MEKTMDGATSTRRDASSAAAASAYDPDARFDLVVSEVVLRHNAAGRMLMARIYQPQGRGLFPTVLDPAQSGVCLGYDNATDSIAARP
jgi:hypothetical protein